MTASQMEDIIGALGRQRRRRAQRYQQLWESLTTRTIDMVVMSRPFREQGFACCSIYGRLIDRISPHGYQPHLSQEGESVCRSLLP